MPDFSGINNHAHDDGHRLPDRWPSDLQYPPDKHSIKAAVQRRGTTCAEISILKGLTPGACSAALNPRSAYPAAEAALAEFFGLSANELFPERYDGNGRRIPQYKDAAVRRTATTSPQKTSFNSADAARDQRIGAC